MSAIKDASLQNSQAQAEFDPYSRPKLGIFNRRAKLAAWQNRVNSYFIDKQNDYNAPKAQRQRWEDANMNPNLAFSQGSPGNQSSAQEAVNYDPGGITDVLGTVLQVASFLSNTALQSTQRSAIQAGESRTRAQAETEVIKQQIMKANPILNGEYVTSFIEKMKAEADMTMSKRKLLTSTYTKSDGGGYVVSSRMQDQMDAEISILQKRLELFNQDGQIKKEVFESKEMQNAILDVQRKFMTDFELTPDNWMQFVKILFTKLLSK